VAVDEEVQQTSSVCTDASADYAFEGRWYINDGDGAYQSLTFTDSSYSYLSNDGDGDIFTLNGTVLAAEVGSSSTEWNVVCVIDENIITTSDPDSDLDIQMYQVFYLKGVLSSDGSTITFADPFEVEPNAIYYLTNYNLQALMSASTQAQVEAAKYNTGYQIDKVVNIDTSPSFTTDISLSSLINAAGSLNYSTYDEDQLAEFTRK